ncbi:hypothetical protein NPIL_186231 [Nephila pilipes]|uniref:Uncharacterized protein n=1 Tax=Nephila pilipes TaxID=299642 RepID=A0A8X6MNG2_NEPPI|nr:hypothetical protein NPIL_186231 [Nephila pilipes]
MKHCSNFCGRYHITNMKADDRLDVLKVIYFQVPILIRGSNGGLMALKTPECGTENCGKRFCSVIPPITREHGRFAVIGFLVFSSQVGEEKTSQETNGFVLKLIV